MNDGRVTWYADQFVLNLLARAAAIRDRKAVAEREVRTVEDAAREALDAERKQFESLVPGLAEEFAKQLKLGGGS